jgi:diguanylate cyclase (GGDEF)-like protein
MNSWKRLEIKIILIQLLVVLSISFSAYFVFYSRYYQLMVIPAACLIVVSSLLIKQEVKKLEEKAMEIYYDPLTGIYNRRYFNENMSHLIKSLSRSSGKISLMMIDIDHFKKFNDTYGHVEGDNCLKIIAKTISRTITRDADFAVRYGGEEFVIVLPNTDEEGLRVLTDKLLENIRNCNIPHANNEAAPHVTVSIGSIAGMVSHTHSTDFYINRADQMLYSSKQGGRNRATFANIA